MEAGGGFVEDVEGVAGFGTGQFGCQFDALGFTATEGGGLLAQGDIAKAYLLEGFQLAVDFGVRFKEGDGFVDGHVEHVGNALAFVANFQSFAVVAFAVAHFAVDIHIGKEIHLNGAYSGTFAVFAAASTHIEREPAGFVAADAGTGKLGEE